MVEKGELGVNYYLSGAKRVKRLGMEFLAYCEGLAMGFWKFGIDVGMELD